jgi:hypothetical protein
MGNIVFSFINSEADLLSKGYDLGLVALSNPYLVALCFKRFEQCVQYAERTIMGLRISPDIKPSGNLIV